MAGKITDLTAGTALAGTEAFEMVQSSTSKRSTISAIATYVRGLFTTTPLTIAEGGTNAATAAAARASLGAIPEATNDGTPFVRQSGAWLRAFLSAGYISGHWYPSDQGLTASAGSTVVTGTIYFAPLVIYKDVTITDLAVEITGAVASSVFQLAVYAADPTTKQPTGTALYSSADLSGATAQAVSVTLGSPLVLPAGMYWAAVNSSSAVGFRVCATGQGWINSFVGSATLSSIARAAPGSFVYGFTQSYNTWPNMTSNSVSESLTNRATIFAYKAQ